jgi:alanyl-tRNA synthetase
MSLTGKTSNEIRESFLNFFKSNQHQIVPSVPMVIKNDPTLMFTNAGMNQFKDIFLGNSPVKYSRIANTQKCLRVSGKHNDLEEVGHDTYHHTMFEMLGNWSFGDYFKREAIRWAWEYLTEVLKIEKDRLYVTIFKGDESDHLDRDSEAYDIWAENIDKSHIIEGLKKDNFWEMGDTGPCGPCSEIHIDIRSENERKKIDGKKLVNKSNPKVIEIWNLVFIQYNRKANGSLEILPDKHVDTGMGFERLCMVVQGKQSNYDTDVFTPIINEIARLTNIEYGEGSMTDIAMRVVADHLRAVSFAIADGQLPSNNKAGYVIRRILRRAVRYAYTYLKQQDPFMCKLVPVLVKQMNKAFPELVSQGKHIIQVISEEEFSFLKTLSTGIKLLEQIIFKANSEKLTRITGKSAFELYDTYGFPLDLTELILREKGMTVDLEEFNDEMQGQKSRSRSDATIETDDWIVVSPNKTTEYVGYDTIETDVQIIRYRNITTKGKKYFHLVFDKTPFYAESGGQVSDSGTLIAPGESIEIIDTKKENNLTIHVAEKLPQKIKNQPFIAKVDFIKRHYIERNHSATHLLHFALRKVLGNHVEQKGSLVHPDYLRFDFSHFQKLNYNELLEIETIVNRTILDNISAEKKEVPIEKAREMGAMMLFGEKYGEKVRIIKFGSSIELCGGTHVNSTGEIGFFKIISESAIAAGVRRIEAITYYKAYDYINDQLEVLNKVKEQFNNPQDILKSVETLIAEKAVLEKKIEDYSHEKLHKTIQQLLGKIKKTGDINLIAETVEADSAADLKNLAFQLKNQVDNMFLILGAEVEGKANLALMISDNLVKEKNLNAGIIIRDVAKEIEGGGGGQPFFATAGGKKPQGLSKAIEKAIVSAMNN